jgi:hypothetical protein
VGIPVESGSISLRILKSVGFFAAAILILSK